MRISDWSSDVCSSDLRIAAAVGGRDRRHIYPQADARGREARAPLEELAAAAPGPARPGVRPWHRDRAIGDHRDHPARSGNHRPPVAGARSEEHTSELQSLMRISYAVFCLKKTITSIYKITTIKKLLTAKT